MPVLGESDAASCAGVAVGVGAAGYVDAARLLMCDMKCSLPGYASSESNRSPRGRERPYVGSELR